jgi:copper transport protein
MRARTPVPPRGGARLAATLTALLVALVAALLPSAASAQTDNSLQSIEPADGSSVTTSPAAIVLSFNQELADDDALTLELSCNNQPQDTAIPEPDDEGLVVTVAITTPLPRGACFVVWILRDGLGETITQGQSSFSVTADPPASATSGVTESTSSFITVPAVTNTPAGDDTVDEGSSGGALWLGRVLSTLSILVLFGALALISVGWPEGPEYVVTVRFLRAIWILGLLGTILYLIAYSADFTNTAFGSAVNPSVWLDLKDDGWTGRGALLRLAMVAASGWVAMRPERIIDPQSAMWAWAVPGFALVAVALSRVAGPVAPLGFVVNVVHVLAVAVWFGGAALVARVVLAGPGEEDLVQATRAFSRISVPAMLVAAITGVIQVIRLDGGDLFSSSHGRVLLLKVIAVAAMLAVSLAARQQVTLRLDRAHELTVPLADRFRRAFGAEAALGVVVLAFSGWMLGLTPPKVDPLAGQSYVHEIPFNDAASGIEARISIGPSAVGLNGIKVEVEAPPEGITDLRVRFVPPAGSNAFVIEQPIPLATAGTAVLARSAGLPFTVPGTWTVQLYAATSTGVLEWAGTTFVVFDEAGNFVTIPASQTTVPSQVSIVDLVTTTAPFATTTTTTIPETSVPSG